MAEQAPWKHVWITGASSGLGEYTARHLASLGCTVSICARSKDKLDAIAADSPNLHAYEADVTDGDRLTELVSEIEAAHGPVDLAIFCAGAWFQNSLEDANLDDFALTMDVNLNGVMRSVKAVLPSMLARGTGHVSWVSSVAGYGGLPNAISYGASKAALINMAEASYNEMARKGIALSVINPGFVKTPMTEKNKFPMPFLMEPEDAAVKMVDGLKAKKFEIAFPWQLVWILKVLNLLPYWLYLRLINKVA